MSLRKILARDDSRLEWSNTRLVRECLQGKQEAWSALIDRYRNLIYSIPIKYDFTADEATDIFQSVCLEMLSELKNLREPEALPKWIMQVAAHKCFHRKQQRLRVTVADPRKELEKQTVPALAEGILSQAEQEQALREAIAALPPRCRKLVIMLFFEEPARPYREVAASLGIALGSVGFIRQRCLDRLRKRLDEAGF
jgi:RNA polymerase sigma factor (sigma-70 family)